VKSKSKPLTFYKKKLDQVFGRYIRARDNHTCYTCGLQMEPTKSQCGHFVPRQYLSLRFDETNCHAQCYPCNMLYNGQPSAYAARLKKDFGPSIVEKLERKRREITKLTQAWYEERIAEYQAKLDALPTF
jgi:5-methylcytosine-specific restriction endonuclease McrA